MREKKELLALSNLDIYIFGQSLSTKEPTKFTPLDIEKIQRFCCSDGCTGVPNFYLSACVVHDFYYRTHRDFEGTPINKVYADNMFKKLIQRKSLFGIFSPMAQWRWLGVKFFAQKAWEE